MNMALWWNWYTQQTLASQQEELKSAAQGIEGSSPSKATKFLELWLRGGIGIRSRSSLINENN